MSTALQDALSAGDREHIRTILNSSLTAAAQVETVSRVGAFLRERTVFADGAAERFRSQAPAERERMLSELVWRLTCHLDGSQTATLGMNRHALTGDFSAVIAEGPGGGTCTLEANP
jgi:hypothetical protein